MEHLGVIVAVCGILLNLIVTIIGGVRAFSRLEISLRAAIDASGKEIDERIDQQARHFGENITALRAKVSEVELYIRDNYVRRDSFYTVKDDLQGTIKELGKELGRRLDRLEGIIHDGRKGGQDSCD